MCGGWGGGLFILLIKFNFACTTWGLLFIVFKKDVLYKTLTLQYVACRRYIRYLFIVLYIYL